MPQPYPVQNQPLPGGSCRPGVPGMPGQPRFPRHPGWHHHQPAASSLGFALTVLALAAFFVALAMLANALRARQVRKADAAYVAQAVTDGYPPLEPGMSVSNYRQLVDEDRFRQQRDRFEADLTVRRSALPATAPPVAPDGPVSEATETA